MAPSPYIFIISIGPVDMNKYARFDEIPSRTLKDIKETKRYGRTDGRTDNVKTVYPPTNTVCGGYKNKDADQLRGNREADQRLCFRYSDSTIPLLPKSETSSL